MQIPTLTSDYLVYRARHTFPTQMPARLVVTDTSPPLETRIATSQRDSSNQELNLCLQIPDGPFILNRPLISTLAVSLSDPATLGRCKEGSRERGALAGFTKGGSKEEWGWGAGEGGNILSARKC